MAMISQLIFRCPTTLRTTMFTFRSLSTAADSDRRRWDEEYLPLFECLWKPKDPNERHQLISYAKKMRAIRNGKYGVEITELEKQTHYETRKEVERILSEVDAAEEEESIGNLICSKKKKVIGRNHWPENLIITIKRPGKHKLMEKNSTEFNMD